MKTSHILIGAGVAIGAYVLAKRFYPAVTPANTGAEPGPTIPGNTGIVPPWLRDVVFNGPAVLPANAPGGGFAVRTSDRGAAISDGTGVRAQNLVQPDSVMTARQRKLAGVYNGSPFSGLTAAAVPAYKIVS